MAHTIMRARDDDDPVPRRLRVPGGLAVASVGSAVMVSVWYGGCDPKTPDPTPDAGRLIESQLDAGAVEDDATDVPADAGAFDLPPDASEPPH